MQLTTRTPSREEFGLNIDEGMQRNLHIRKILLKEQDSETVNTEIALSTQLIAEANDHKDNIQAEIAELQNIRVDIMKARNFSRYSDKFEGLKKVVSNLPNNLALFVVCVLFY